MPKIIPGVRDTLVRVAREQLTDIGYSSMTVRSVARAAGVGVGTVYNYFSSKDELVAECMLSDWIKMTDRIRSAIDVDPTPRSAVEAAARELRAYITLHSGTIKDEGAKRVFASALAEKHKLVRSSLAAVVMPVSKSEFGASFFAEALIAWVSEGHNTDELMPYLIYALER